MFWKVIKKDFMNLVREFEARRLNLDRMNYAMITLIPNILEAKYLKNFRPISVINSSFKIFAKAFKNRLIKVADTFLLIR